MTNSKDEMRDYHQYAPIISAAFWKSYLITMRPYLLFLSGITGAAGLFLSSLPFGPGMFLYLIAFFFSYGFGQALTDCSQTDTDSISSPYRPLVQKKIRKKDVAIVSLLGLAAIGIVVALANPINIILAIMAVIGLSTYTIFKRRWWSGPGYNAAIVVLLFLIGYLAGIGTEKLSPKKLPEIIATGMLVFMGYSNFVLTGYFKDISADRATGYNTMPVLFGRRTSALVSDILALLSVISALIAIYCIGRSDPFLPKAVFFLPFAVAGIIAAVLAQIRLHNVTSDSQAHGAIAPVVHSYILLLSAVIMAIRPNVIPPLYYILFLLAMKYRPEKSQI